MKRLLSLICVFCFAASLCSCGTKTPDVSTSDTSQSAASIENSSESNGSMEDMSEPEPDIELSPFSTVYLNKELTEGMTVNSEVAVPNFNGCTIYRTEGKKANLDAAKRLFWKDSDSISYDYNEDSDIESLSSEDGKELTNGNDLFTYYSSENTWAFYSLVQYAYGGNPLTMPHITMTEDERAFFEKQPMIENAVKQVEELYSLSPELSFAIQQCYEVKTENLLAMLEKLKGTGELNDVKTGDEYEFSGDEWEEAYYLYLGLNLDGIPCASGNEPFFQCSNPDAVTASSYVEVIVTSNGIEYLSARGIFDVSADHSENLLSVDSAMERITAKYSHMILPEEHTINDIWLEYVFVHDPIDFYGVVGELVPHWCFQNVRTTDMDIYEADRISAVTGDDFEYGV